MSDDPSGNPPLVDPRGSLASRWLFSFEKWYFDGQTDDGAFFFLYLAPMVLCGKRSAELVISLFPRGGGNPRRSFHLGAGELEVDEDRCGARMAGGDIALGPGETRIRLALDDAGADLCYRPVDPPWTPPDDGLVVKRGGRALRWIVPIPRARVEGVVRVADSEIRLDGYGYSDFVQTDIPPWSLPLRELLWGRVLGPETQVVFNRLGVAAGSGVEHLPFGLVRLGDGPVQETRGLDAELTGWEDHPPTGDRYPTRLELALPADDPLPPLTLHDTTLHLGEFVADVQRFGSGLERWLYRTVTGDPVEYKLFARARSGGQELDAWSAHEWIRWGRGR
jgi:hypothetical protein